MREAAQYLIMLLALLTLQRPATATEPRSPEPVMAHVESQQRIFAGEFAVYAYCAEQYPHICGGNPTTKSGEPVTPGVTVAADPAVIPLGTRVYIDGIMQSNEQNQLYRHCRKEMPDEFLPRRS